MNLSDKSLAALCLRSDRRTSLCLIQDIPRCTAFHCCSVILDQVPASSCQGPPINTHSTLKSSHRRGHSRRVSFQSLPLCTCKSHMRRTSKHNTFLLKLWKLLYLRQTTGLRRCDKSNSVCLLHLSAAFSLSIRKLSFCFLKMHYLSIQIKKKAVADPVIAVPSTLR